MRPSEPPREPRRYYRAVVRVGRMYGATRQSDHVEWHHAACPAPRGACLGAGPGGCAPPAFPREGREASNG